MATSESLDPQSQPRRAGQHEQVPRCLVREFSCPGDSGASGRLGLRVLASLGSADHADAVTPETAVCASCDAAIVVSRTDLTAPPSTRSAPTRVSLLASSIRWTALRVNR